MHPTEEVWKNHERFVPVGVRYRKSFTGWGVARSLFKRGGSVGDVRSY